MIILLLSSSSSSPSLLFALRVCVCDFKVMSFYKLDTSDNLQGGKQCSLDSVLFLNRTN